MNEDQINKQEGDVGCCLIVHVAKLLQIIDQSTDYNRVCPLIQVYAMICGLCTPFVLPSVLHLYIFMHVMPAFSP